MFRRLVSRLTLVVLPGGQYGKVSAMPTLIAAAFIGKKPFVWTCSDCDAVFSLERMTSTPSVLDLLKVHSDFRRHCEREHCGLPAVGLIVPSQETTPKKRKSGAK
jgi:hypothetical protein